MSLLWRIAARVAESIPVPEVEQLPAMCGPASLRAVLLFWGLDVSQDELAAMSEWTERLGAPAEGLADAARALGFDARVESDRTLDDLKSWSSRGVPIIVEWFSKDEGHYSVLVSANDDEIGLMDPYLGEDRFIRTDSFMRTWFDFEDTNDTTGFLRRQLIVVTPPV